MNLKQRIILVGGSVAALLTVIYPPFILTGGIFPSFQYAFVWSPPEGFTDGQDYRIDVFWPVVLIQLSLVAVVTLLLFRFQRQDSLAEVSPILGEESVWPPPPNVPPE